jgi:hypothetical protein
VGNDVQLICTLEPATFAPEMYPGFSFGPLPADGPPRPPTAVGTSVGTLNADGAARNIRRRPQACRWCWISSTHADG